MDLIANIIFLIVFVGMLFIVAKIMFDSNFEKLFKQGRINSIRVAYFIVIIIVSFLIAFTFKEVILAIYNIIA